jgi:hypothetical protein
MLWIAKANRPDLEPERRMMVRASKGILNLAKVFNWIPPFGGMTK